MRYRTLVMYAGVLRASGYLLILGSALAAVVLGTLTYQHPAVDTIAVAVVILLAVLANGLIAAASGHVLGRTAAIAAPLMPGAPLHTPASTAPSPRRSLRSGQGAVASPMHGGSR